MSSYKNVNSDYTLTCDNGNGTFTVNAQTIFNGNVVYTVPAVTISPFLTVASNNTGNITDMGLLAQTGPTTFAGLRFDTTANVWQLSSSVDANGAPIAAYTNIATGNVIIGGSNTQIQFNDSGALGGSSNLTFNSATKTLTVIGPISAVGNITSAPGNYFIGNGAFLTGVVAASGNYIAAGSSNVSVAPNDNVSIGVTGVSNVAVFASDGEYVTGNISATGNVAAGNYFIGNGSQLTGILTNIDWQHIPSNIIPNANVTYSLGNATNQWKDLWISNNTIYINSIPINLSSTILVDGTSANTLAVNNNPVLIESQANVVLGNIQSGNVNGNIISGNAFAWSNGLPIISNTGNAEFTNISVTGNVLAGIDISATGNITGNYVLGNGAFLTDINASNIVGSYSNSNVASYLPTYFGNVGVGNITSNTNSNINLVPNGTGVVSIGNAVGILMGTPTAGNLVSNAVTLTTSTPVNTGIAQLNYVLGKLVPTAPPAFPASQTLTLSGLATYRMANITQTNNTANSLTVSAGASVNKVLRAATYATNTISTAGPGDSGTVTAYRNGTSVGNVTLTGSSNGTYGANLVISANQDYHVSNASITAGFWYVFSAAISGSNAPAGWNDITIVDTAAGSTNVPAWYYDNSAPGTPTFSSLSIAPTSNTVTYSSTVPHYTSATQFTLGFTASRLSGNMYPTTDTFVTGTAGGAFAAPASVTYQASSLGTNILEANASATVSTTANITTGFGNSATGPSVSVNNSYATGTQAFTTTLAANVLYKTGSTSSLTFLDEGNIYIGSTIGSGTGPAFRIVNPSGNTATDTPVFTGSEAAFDSQTGPLYNSDATVVGNVLKNDTTNYAFGYLPAGPNLNPSRNIDQYFTFKFVRTSTSKFDIQITGTIAGLWVALPGSTIDSTSGLNGWIDASQIYSGAGIPGSNTGAGGNGSDGCALGGVVPLNTTQTAERTTITFGTVSSSSTATNEIYVRIKLTSGQSVTSLSLQTASN